MYQNMSAKLGELEYKLITSQTTLELKGEEVEELQQKLLEKEEKIKMLEEQLNK